MGRTHTGARGGAGGWTWLTVAVAAGCAVATATADPSWAGPGPDPRAAVQLAPASRAAVPSDSDLEVIRLDPDAAPPGGTTTVHGFVANRGPDTTASPFTVIVDLPPGVTAQGPYFPEDCQVLPGGRRVRCAFRAGLPQGRTATALVKVRISPTVKPGPLHGGRVEVLSPNDRDPRDNRQPFTIEVVETAAG
ncbi:hypothetical protein PUR71_31770 [Streptomyces sp. SP17BM10]|uniref:hypothetical protein n=1 Tax=Streptomyces sp. SP17BM10 TaxID=3002530 RepID=UPI002E769609|nr:hypothetical protein [Streptomyces sp. SP17BM10]MEE1787447.1 hypothetical protein [Streptomyces sp. SP17BM10]